MLKDSISTHDKQKRAAPVPEQSRSFLFLDESPQTSLEDDVNMVNPNGKPKQHATESKENITSISKKRGQEEKKNIGMTEWLENSIIKGGLETFTPGTVDPMESQEQDTLNYLQVSTCEPNINEGKAKQSKDFDPIKTSTPKKKFNQSHPQRNGNTSSQAPVLNKSVCTPARFQKFLWEQHQKTNETGISINEVRTDNNLSEHEQRSDMSIHNYGNTTEVSSAYFDDFAIQARNRIRARFMNVSL